MMKCYYLEGSYRYCGINCIVVLNVTSYNSITASTVKAFTVFYEDKDP